MSGEDKTTLHFENKHVTWSLVKCTCSWTSSKSELSISMKMGTAPAWITTRVWWDVPEAMFVKTHAASNCGDTTPLLWQHDLLLLNLSGKANHTHIRRHIPPAWAYHQSIPSGVSNCLMAVVGLRAQIGIFIIQRMRGLWWVYCQSDPTFIYIQSRCNDEDQIGSWRKKIFLGSIKDGLMSPGSTHALCFIWFFNTTKVY